MNDSQKFVLALILLAVVSFAGGYWLSATKANEACKAAMAEPVASCTTDEDCFRKYGCGGYADPCE